MTAAQTTGPGAALGNVETPSIDLVSKALWDQDGRISELAPIGAIIRIAAVAAEAIGNMYGVDEGPKRAINDLGMLLYEADDRLRRSIDEIDALHSIAYRNIALLRASS